jgi:hypothetical protein
MIIRISFFYILCLIFSEASGAYIYCGEPFGEALYDVILGGGTIISHELVQSSKTERTDVFKLRDGSLLVISSNSQQLGEPYTIKKILINGNSNSLLHKFKSIPGFTISELHK